MQTVLRCHMAAFEAIGGVPKEILYDRMKTAVIGEGGGSIVYNRAFIDFARHYGFQPKACRPYRAKTKGKSSFHGDECCWNDYALVSTRTEGGSKRGRMRCQVLGGRRNR
jgi:hypothetical protein